MLIIETLTDFTHVEDVFLTEPSLGIGLEKAVNSASFSRYLDLESKILHATTWTQRQLQRRVHSLVMISDRRIHGGRYLISLGGFTIARIRRE